MSPLGKGLLLFFVCLLTPVSGIAIGIAIGLATRWEYLPQRWVFPTLLVASLLCSALILVMVFQGK